MFSCIIDGMNERVKKQVKERGKEQTGRKEMDEREKI